MTQFELSNHVIKNVNNLKPAVKLLLITIVSFGGENNNWKCWPSQKTLAEMVGCKPRQIIDHVQKLREEGFITTEQRYDNSLIYTIEVSTLMQKTTVGGAINDSRVMQKTTVATAENCTLTNQEQTIEQTTTKPLYKEEGESKEVEESTGTIENEIVNNTSVSTVSKEVVSSSPCTSNSPSLTEAEHKESNISDVQAYTTINTTPEWFTYPDIELFRLAQEVADYYHKPNDYEFINHNANRLMQGEEIKLCKGYKIDKVVTYSDTPF
ncbi:TPA: helix-turn-helix domain-containing protein [Klebsiella quasipneumoniae]|nr:helix-turn-helix domain-containing protein [Klebsiella quasipneumoniae]